MTTAPDPERCKYCNTKGAVKRPHGVVLCDPCWGRDAYESGLCSGCGKRQR